MKLSALILIATLGAAQAGHQAFLDSMKGKTAHTFSHKSLCEELGKQYQGYGWGMSGGKTSLNVHCSGQKYTVACKGSPFTCCSASFVSGSDAKCNSGGGSGGSGRRRRRRRNDGSAGTGDAACAKKAWSCPSSWSTGSTSAPGDAADAKAFIAAHNIYRCMHDVQAVQWDADVYKGAKSWSSKTGSSMVHSHSPSQYRKFSDGENLAGTFESSKHRGVDSTHMWYEEIDKDCNYKKSCYQTFTPGHFTAMIWSSINKVAYSDTSKKLAVGRYRGCDGNPPNFNNGYKTHVPPPKHNYGDCLAKVLGCATFGGLAESDVDGCGAKVTANSKDPAGNWVWKTVYKQHCKAKYAGIMSKLSRLDDAAIPQLFQPVDANAWLVAVATALVGAAVMVRRRRTGGAQELLAQDDDEGLELAQGLE